MGKGKDEEEATEIVNKLQSKWKENLHKSHCIDNKNMMGLSTTINANTSNQTENNVTNNNPNNNANNFNPIQPAPTSFTSLPTEMPLPYNDDMEITDNLNEGPQRKRQKLNNPNIPPLHSPVVLQPNHPPNNPHIQGLGVPQIDQVHNPFTHPHSQSYLPQNDGMDVIQFMVQSDGPSPMKPRTVGFDDDEEDEEDDDKNEKEKPSLSEDHIKDNEENKNQNSLKEENEEEEVKENKNDSNELNVSKPHIVNGRDLNAPLCSDDDDTDDQEDLDPSDKIICQFTRVNRKKNEWSVDLKHGLMHINGKDYAFQKATGGTFSWSS